MEWNPTPTLRRRRGHGSIILFASIVLMSFNMRETIHFPLCDTTHLTVIENFNVLHHNATGSLIFRAKIAIDADGSPRAYHPKNIGLDDNSRARVAHDAHGRRVIQKKGDPNPGYYVSTTSLQNPKLPKTDPRRYVDSEKIPYFVMPEILMWPSNIRVGDMAYVYNTKTQKGGFAILADIGPTNRLGEASIALARKLGIANISPRKGGLGTPDIIYVVFPNSGMGEYHHRSVADIERVGREKLKDVGANVVNCF
jgi:Fungal chitosanase of glycosyl hydrolase group 75